MENTWKDFLINTYEYEKNNQNNPIIKSVIVAMYVESFFKTTKIQGEGFGGATALTNILVEGKTLSEHQQRCLAKFQIIRNHLIHLEKNKVNPNFENNKKQTDLKYLSDGQIKDISNEDIDDIFDDIKNPTEVDGI